MLVVCVVQIKLMMIMMIVPIEGILCPKKYRARGRLHTRHVPTSHSKNLRQHKNMHIKCFITFIPLKNIVFGASSTTHAFTFGHFPLIPKTCSHSICTARQKKSTSWSEKNLPVVPLGRK